MLTQDALNGLSCMPIDRAGRPGASKPVAIAIALPPELWAPVGSGTAPFWDTLMVPVDGGQTWTVHWPSLRDQMQEGKR